MRRSRGFLLLGVAMLASLAGCKRQESPLRLRTWDFTHGMGWRGNGTGVFPDANPPEHWSPEQNVLWRTPLQSWSNASPVLAGNRVFACAEPSTLLCADANTGRILWSHTNNYVDLLAPEQRPQAEQLMEAAGKTRGELRRAEAALRRLKNQQEAAPDPAAHEAQVKELQAQIDTLQGQLGAAQEFEFPPTQVDLNGYTTPTPTTDGQHVWALFGNGIASCYDLEGKRIWTRLVERPVNQFGQSASPLLTAGKLLVHVESLHALDPANGRTLWQAPAKQCWGSPVVALVGDEPMAVLADGGIVRIDDGSVMTTKCPSLAHNSPTIAGDTIYYLEGKAHAVQITAAAKQGRIERKYLWNVELLGEGYYASPVVRNGLAFAVNDAGVLTVLDAATGAMLVQRQLETAKGAVFYPSVVSAGGRIYVTSDDGTTHVLTADREAREIATNKLGPLRSTPIFAGGRAYFRTADALWCVGEATK